MPGLARLTRSTDGGQIKHLPSGHPERGPPAGVERATLYHDMPGLGRVPFHENPPGLRVDVCPESAKAGRAHTPPPAVVDLPPL
jgi:hypothetical protein